MNHHYLILTWAEDGPGGGTFTDDLDWDVSHPHDCTWDRVSRNGIEWLVYDCAVGWELEHVGVEAFGDDNARRARAWEVSAPAAIPFEHYHEEIRIGWATEHETGLRMVTP